MLTKNFYNWLFSLATKKEIANGYTDYTGATANAYPYTSMNSLSVIDNLHYLSIGTMSSSAYGVKLGTGVTPATFNDYTLENVIIEGLSVANQESILLNAESDNSSVSATYSIKNISSEPINISEIGLFNRAYVDGSTTRKLVLLERTVLEEPITIAPGQTKQITYTIRMNYPTA